MQMSLQWTKADQWLPGNAEGRDWVWRKDYKGAPRELFGGGIFVHYVDCGDEFMCVRMCQNLPIVQFNYIQFMECQIIS